MTDRATRARRFHLQLRLHYRGKESSQWFQSVSENISRSGVLFRAEPALGLNAELEIVFELPGAAGIYCSTRVVRVIRPESPGESSAVAASILGYRFVRVRSVGANSRTLFDTTHERN